MPGRERQLARAIESLRPQVDRIALYWNGPELQEPDVPVHEVVVAPGNERGSGGKLAWADHWDGLYLSCDDDLAYPADYVATMRGWVEQWGGQALVTAHGRIMPPQGIRFQQAKPAGHCLQDVPAGQWINYPGPGVMAFDTSLNVPADLPGQNVEDAELAIWAQQHEVPIWLVPHTAGWLTYLQPQGYTIWEDEARHGFTKRNAVIRGHTEWAVHKPRAGVIA